MEGVEYTKHRLNIAPFHHELVAVYNSRCRRGPLSGLGKGGGTETAAGNQSDQSLVRIAVFQGVAIDTFGTLISVDGLLPRTTSLPDHLLEVLPPSKPHLATIPVEFWGVQKLLSVGCRLVFRL